MSALDSTINEHFAGLAVRKDLTKAIKGNAIVPTYVLEYLLGQHCATDDPDSITAGVERVRQILARHFVHRNEAELIKSTIKEKGRHKIIDKLTVELNDKEGYYQAKFTNLGLKGVPVDVDYIKAHPKLLVGGIWCIVDMIYEVPEDPKACPWHVDQLKPIQVSKFDFEQFIEARKKFATEEWMGLLLQTIGFNPEKFSRRETLLQLTRLVAYCERNYNLMELGPKGTGKSHIYSEFSPHGILISGGEITAAKLFVNNASGKIGLVGYWDSICFDEFAGKDKKVNKDLVDIMKNYMAQKTFSRGIESLGAEASMVFMGNTKKSVGYMMKYSNIFEPLPDKYIDSAFLDRIHAYLPGWEVSPIANDLFTNGYGLIVDYFAEILRHLRSQDFSHLYDENFSIESDITTRDRDGVRKTFGGLMKILYPHQECSDEEMEEILSFAMECRKRVKDHIIRIDETFEPKAFDFVKRAGGAVQVVKTAEEIDNPAFVGREPSSARQGADEEDEDQRVMEPDIAGSDAGNSESAATAQSGPSFGESTEKLIEGGEGPFVEFKSTLRVNLHTDKKDDKIEHSVLKTIAGFLNTRGGVLLIGVQDDGTPLGLESDQFANEDKLALHLQNLINDRIGEEHAPHIIPKFESHDGKRVLRVECSPGHEPAFVITGKFEPFYIRSGHATNELSPRKITPYLRRQFPDAQ
ncbi:BREX system Lon protease-like protein BrxL [Haloferula sp.]|uniref:BREX system Lon protease-like protein BrxL n=1 Tax=Haloferula sp. TaxID=2497595 RepID=UPI00329ABBAC